MPRKPNYQFEKRQREMDRKARKEEKLRLRQARPTEQDDSPASTPSGESTVPHLEHPADSGEG